MKRIGKDDFKLLKVIGKGSYGKVYLVEKLADEELQSDMSHMSSMLSSLPSPNG